MILSEHIKNNLWLEDEDTQHYLSDDIASDLEAAMTVRREGFPGDRTPDGFLKRFKATTLGRVVKAIETSPDTEKIDLGFMLLTLSGKTVTEVSKSIDTIVAREKNDGKGHDFTVRIGVGSTGLTVHCNGDPMPAAAEKLRAHCVMKKYAQQVDSWFGILISPKNAVLRFVANLNYKWERSVEMDAHLQRFLQARERSDASVSKETMKVGRNAPCPCGSGRKYKKCCTVR